MQQVQAQTAPTGGGEERLTVPCRALLSAVMAHQGSPALTIVGKADVGTPNGGGRSAGVPDMLLYDAAGRLIVCVELKAPGTGSDPAQFTIPHDQNQWQRYRNLPNLIYTDGNSWSLWHDGKASKNTVTVCGNILDPNTTVTVAPAAAAAFFDEALTWAPAPIRTVKRLAFVSAKHCRMLREQLEGLDAGLIDGVSGDWRDMLFPDLDQRQFLDAYAQTVTFALVVAGSLNIEMTLPVDPKRDDLLNLQLHRIASELQQRRGLLGKSLSLLTLSDAVRGQMHAYLQALLTVVSSVDWNSIRGEAGGTGWLHFYEGFLAEYDRDLRKQSGSYYTPAPIVDWMTRFTDNLLRSSLAVDSGYADDNVAVVDPAAGAGTYLLSILDRVEENVTHSHGPGQVPHALDAAMRRLVGFEIQSGPYAVTQLRLAEHLKAKGSPATDSLRVYLTDTLSDPAEMPTIHEPVSKPRDAANKDNHDKPVVVVIGNPPYREGAGGDGGWVEDQLMADWKPPTAWGVSAHTKNLSNLYVYFWRWGAWQAFEDAGRGNSDACAGIVSFVAPTGFLTGDGFQQMRSRLREQCSEIWVLHLSPEGHQAPASHQIFPAMRQPVAIVTAVRTRDTDRGTPATVRFHMVPPAKRPAKIKHIKPLTDPNNSHWSKVKPPANPKAAWRGPLMPAPEGVWDDMISVGDLFPWSVSGVMAGRTWPIAPHPQILRNRWAALIALCDPPEPQPQNLQAIRDHFVEHKQDRTIDKPIVDNLTDPPTRRGAIVDETSAAITPVPYGYRSFDRQWIIHDKRVINRPNPDMWAAHSGQQIYLKVPALDTDSTRPLIAGSAGVIVSFSEAIPDMDYLSGSRAGRIHPLWRNSEPANPDDAPSLLDCLQQPYGYRSFDRQWIIHDKRVINRPNPDMWAAHSGQQIYLKVPALDTDSTRPLIAGSAGVIVSFSEAIPDMHYLSGSRAGRIWPLWRNSEPANPNIAPGLLDCLQQHYGTAVTPQDLLAYVAAVVAHPAYTDTYRQQLMLATEIRLPLTDDAGLFVQAVAAGREILSLHTYGQWPSQTPPAAKPRAVHNRPRITVPLPDEAHTLSHDPDTGTLLVHGILADSPHQGEISNVPAAVYEYTVGTMNVLESWFGYRRANPAGRRRSPLDSIDLPRQWDHQTYTDALLDLLNVLRLLLDQHPHQRKLLNTIRKRPLITSQDLRDAQRAVSASRGRSCRMRRRRSERRNSRPATGPGSPESRHLPAGATEPTQRASRPTPHVDGTGCAGSRNVSA